MKINELISDFQIYTTNEESTILEGLDSVVPLDSYNDREQLVIQNLIRKSLVTKVTHNNSVLVLRNV